MADFHYLVPEQQQGLHKHMEHTIVADTAEEAEDCFVDAKERLLDVNNWNKFSAIKGGEFRLKDSHGKETERHARKGDHIRIDIPGNPQQDGGFDWVAIEAIVYDDYPDMDMESFAMRMRPCINPITRNEEEIAWSRSNDATSTFVIERRGRKLVAAYYGRNEGGNMDTSVIYNTLNSAWLGLSDGQWESLIAGILEPGMVKRT